MEFFKKKSKDLKASGSMSEGDASSVTSRVTSVSSTTSKKGLVKCQKPFEEPLNPTKPPEFKLSDQEQACYDEVLEHFQKYAKTADIPVNDSAGAASHSLTDEEKAWLTKECFLRYLRATKWKVGPTIKRIEDTIVWRRTFGVVNIEGHSDSNKILTSEMVEPENLTGKNLILGYDIDNRPCLYLRNRYQNTSASIRQVQHLVFMLERVIQFMPPGQDTLALLIDFKAAPAHLKLSAKFPSLSISKQVLHILQNHYPERLGRGLFTNIPWIGYTFFKVVGPFIDPYTRLKTIYDQPFENFVPKEQLDKEFNGMLDFEYVHDVYWPIMNEIAEKKAAIVRENFKKLGGGIGLSEYDLKRSL
ncbi:CRAL/TRIO domain-containing protein [Metschnikowia bicuspidata var. bicuspidata NRRL YB-4993]|uniref:SEC14 homolog 3 n=1 Tax=Metschnikowia bicuspidata var. bicuspidata NRRL YB-4993 TaxID=869754 RepID=A0A1A0HGZ5_9ASCO|nr:CRAL/TRIO domain-containing protein [Metschnikowia bicuspidata var. bicuspidata NRRL YB-4993]OBA23449.1 CRAL/TRIO domain-containing protein [Metschnikowia bicuspidata var. bicuspidata NRRL YB-4993]